MVELLVGLGAAAIAVGIRYLMTPLVGNAGPFVFVVAAVAIATILAGWRAGLIAIIAGQVLTLYAIIGPVGNFYADEAERRTAVVISSISQLILLVTIALYQREVDRATAGREARLRLLDDALKEIDHRTRNNYQTVLALIDLQARRSTDEAVVRALRQVGDRIQAVANASQQLALRSQGLDAVRLDEHLCALVEQIEKGLSRDGIRVGCDVDGVTASADTATSISIIVNELVTNALKHAFNGERPGQVVVSGRAGSAFELIVADDGKGMKATRRSDQGGLGTRLVESFARQLGARHEIDSTDSGTTHKLTFPTLS